MLLAEETTANQVDDEVKRMAGAYNQIEAQLSRSAHYLKKDEIGGATTITQAWMNGAGDPIKVTVEMVDASGRELTEYVGHDLADPYSGFNYEGMFVLNRKETPLPDGGTEVDETRRYFDPNEGGSYLIRELKKTARFKTGESLDTAHIPNVLVHLEEQSADNRSAEERKAEYDLISEPEQIATSLREAGSPESDPFANIKRDSDKFRVIHGTVSPDGRYAIALGFAQTEPIDWDKLIETESSENGPTYYAEDAENVCNYVIDLAQQKILGKTGCNYFGTRRRYNHRSCIVLWSPDSTKYVELYDGKWASEGCVAGKVNPGPKFAGAADLDKTIEKKTYAFVKKNLDAEGSLSMSVKKISDDGVIDLDALDECSSGDCKGDTIFAVHEQLRLRDKPGGVGLEILHMRRLPNQE